MSKPLAKSGSTLAALLMLGLAPIAARSHTMVAHLETQNRQCLNTVNGSTQETIASGVRVSGATSSEMRLLNQAVAKINSLAAGGRFSGLNGARVVFHEYLHRVDSWGRPYCLPATQSRGPVEIARRCPPGTQGWNIIASAGTGLLIHEMAHHVGNRGHYNGYPIGCQVSQYCSHKASGHAHTGTSRRNEEFAEVFTAFVVNPSLLHRTPGCGPAIRHMERMFGKRSQGPSCGRPRTMIADLGERPRPAVRTSAQPVETVRPIGARPSAPRPAPVYAQKSSWWSSWEDSSSAHTFWLQEREIQARIRAQRQAEARPSQRAAR